MSSTTKVSSAVMQTYNRFPITATKGKGSFLWDDNGEKYLDYTSGIATCNLGHVPDNVQHAISNQLKDLWHCSNLYHIPSQEKLAALLTEYSCLDQVFFCNSGAEANEAAIKIAKKYAKDKGYDDRTEIITFEQSFHGRTGSTMAATAQEKIHQGFTPLTEGFRYLPFNNKESLSEIDNGKTSAVLLEVIQGEGGIHTAEKDWLKQLAAICKQADILLMIDEIQTGIGRTGSLFAYQPYGIEPDVITVAKGLGSGFPIGAMLAKQHIAASFSPGTHGSTFGGNPVAAAAGIATLKEILSDGFLENCKEGQEELFNQLKSIKEISPLIKDIRGKGYLMGIEVMNQASAWIEKLREKQILVLPAGEKVVRILPPLTTTKEELQICIQALKEVALELGGNTNG
ncbi:N-acetylornithine aminotransferase [Oceanobacillus iheyensis HTE831]|uniref:Acetylornithine aminotransferase n=1 Tax=Oceanobacillus iheyensis (strain DSM 14371 / CIP 107618 / JCM 11309 / KCTC 3954 / HTE831) TaxID=221109 RepID=ARGD_OCEIH|nr:acetylornithine transaminase [Oceanobacillus iheyensis]Q8CUM9.1 RecName: Full=Acetylornithine aminotransferase; Short=ACOAT [Oceanobacillus iheyensis HTE831]BAC13034.1 N-acetylornithine aminotransferase [Oceanobacillus iheyensis HTE831]